MNIRCVVITGALSLTRAEIVKKLGEAGVVVDERVTTRTDVVIVGKRPGKSKLASASRFNCPTMNWQEAFSKIIEAQSAEQNVESQAKRKPPEIDRLPWMDNLRGEKSVRF